MKSYGKIKSYNLKCFSWKSSGYLVSELIKRHFDLLKKKSKNYFNTLLKNQIKQHFKKRLVVKKKGWDFQLFSF